MIFGEPERRRPSKTMKDLLYLKQKGKCNYCGKKMDIRYFHVDHKTPMARGGADTPANSQLLCAPCNNRKGNMTDGEFRRAYRLSPARKAKSPPSREIPQSHFDRITKERQKRRRKQRQAEDWW